MRRITTGLITWGAVAGVTACGSTSSAAGSPSSSSAGVTSLCTTQQAAPHYSNGVAAVANGSNRLSGAGSTFIAPMMSVWSDAYSRSAGVQVAYQSIGSGGGIKQVQAGTVDFGDSDAYMKDADIAQAKGPIVQIPLVLAPVVVAYNLPGVAAGIHLDGDAVGKIFAGKITKWSDPAIKELNPRISLPDVPIAVAHRSDGSGTTDIFTDYLTKESPAWVQALGGADKSRGKTVAWPVGIGGKGNEGVSASINQTPGGIGYVELAFATQQNLTYAYVKNRSGQFVEPCVATVAAAAGGIQYPADLRFDLTDSSAQNAYPVTGTTWALVYENQADAGKAAALVNYFSWVLTTGQDMTTKINYTPLGSDLQSRSVGQLRKITVGGKPVVP